MENKIREALDLVRAEDALRERTASAVTAALARRQRRRYPMRYAVAAACLFVLLTISGCGIYFTPVATISVDVNPSLELSVNRFDRVIAATPFNEDAQMILSSAKLKNMRYHDALELLLCSEGFTPYRSADISITVAGSSDEHSSEILRSIRRCDAVNTLNASCHAGHHENTAAAHAANLSLGKYEAYLILHELDSSISPDDVQGMTMWEIRQRITDLGGTLSGHGGHGSGSHNSSHAGDSSNSSTNSGNGKKNHGNGHHGDKGH
ncbi:MAG: hypothetical protein IKM11_07330 [Oscillospiraceae bacterium]|nr:hypothetical protein [Oscillospiraceae bacterium]